MFCIKHASQTNSSKGTLYRTLTFVIVLVHRMRLLRSDNMIPNGDFVVSYVKISTTSQYQMTTVYLHERW